ncbi:hypothetical protein BDV95DRAFT_610808 [Massariosphaeria phaeospora]|uniref:RanBP2-type domain-containing protein n=1 Tax=Massariosphaeria phaeospora TaxID=100035 RepID=A0A7C8I0I8_9PLEO|nr:hypothetical protein BDV95DRAFT_610808 [Massariosphaeria phaeospora]
MSRPTVPEDMWICCVCNQGNLLAHATDRCPVCEHERNDSCCIGPGQQYSETLPYQFQFHNPTPAFGNWYLPTMIKSCGLESFGQLEYLGASDTAPCDGQPPDTWYCSECDALNMNYVDLCPVCGQGTRPGS